MVHYIFTYCVEALGILECTSRTPGMLVLEYRLEMTVIETNS
jgi:hypothetical protein